MTDREELREKINDAVFTAAGDVLTPFERVEEVTDAALAVIEREGEA